MWVGFDQPKTIGRDAYGARYALPIWSDFMRRAAQRGARRRSSTVPSGLHDEQLCRVSYLRPVEGCPVYTEYFKEGDDVPSRLCPVHQGTREAAGQAGVRGHAGRDWQQVEGNLPMKLWSESS